MRRSAGLRGTPGRARRSMDYAEGTDHTFAVRRQQITDDGKRAVARTPVRLDERARRGANPCSANRIADQAQHRGFELALVANLEGGAIGEKRVGNLTKVLH